MIGRFLPFSDMISPPWPPPAGARKRRICSRCMTFCWSSASFFASIAFSRCFIFTARSYPLKVEARLSSLRLTAAYKCAILRSRSSASAFARLSSPAPCKRLWRSFVTKHVHVLRSLLQIISLHDEHLVLPVQFAELLPEVLHFMQSIHLLFRNLANTRVAFLHDGLVDHNRIRVIGDNRCLRYFNLTLLQEEEELDVELLVRYDGQVVVKLLFNYFQLLQFDLVLLLAIGEQAVGLLLDGCELPDLVLDGPALAAEVHGALVARQARLLRDLLGGRRQRLVRNPLVGVRVAPPQVLAGGGAQRYLRRPLPRLGPYSENPVEVGHRIRVDFLLHSGFEDLRNL